MCLTRVLDTFRTHLRLAKKGHGTYIRLSAALLWGFALAQMHLMHIPDAPHARPRRILHAFQMHSNVTLELSCTVPQWTPILCHKQLWRYDTELLCSYFRKFMDTFFHVWRFINPCNENLWWGYQLVRNLWSGSWSFTTCILTEPNVQ